MLYCVYITCNRITCLISVNTGFYKIDYSLLMLLRLSAKLEAFSFLSAINAKYFLIQNVRLIYTLFETFLFFFISGICSFLMALRITER